MPEAFQADFGKTAGDYARHRAGFPDAFFQRLGAADLLPRGGIALDLGSGTGTVARGLARAGMRVTGADIAVPMLEQARRLSAAEGLQVDFIESRAETVPLPDGGLDLVTAGQCWHWFDRARAAAEARRLLRPGGALVIAHFDWLPLAGNLVEATENLIRKHNPAWAMHGGTGVHRAWFADLAMAGFTDLQSASFDVMVPYSPEDWRGRIRASAGVGGSLGGEAVAAFDAEHAVLLAERFPGTDLAVPHRCWWVWGRKPL